MVLPFVMAPKVPEREPRPCNDDGVRVQEDDGKQPELRPRWRRLVDAVSPMFALALTLFANYMLHQRIGPRSVEASSAVPAEAPRDAPAEAESSQPRAPTAGDEPAGPVDARRDAESSQPRAPTAGDESARPDGPAGPVDAPGDAVGSPSQPAQGGCPAGMVRVPTGTFRMGSPDGEGEDREHPQHEVTLSGYCIDRTEVTVKEYRACVAAGGCTATPSKMEVQQGASPVVVKMWCNGKDRADHPINCVSWEQAVAYCRSVQKRLPTEAEWEYAARGSDGRKYPWGDQPPSASRLNACQNECVLMAERDLKVEWHGMYNDDDGWPTTAPVGSYPGGASPFGVLNLAGNVSEWTADSAEPYTAAAARDPQRSGPGEGRVIRGSGWLDNNPSWVRAASRFYSVERDQASLEVGFRCARGD